MEKLNELEINTFENETSLCYYIPRQQQVEGHAGLS